MIATHQQLVAGLYLAIFNRAPDQAGLAFWTSRLDGGATLAEVAQGFIQHPMYAAQLASSGKSAYFSLFQNAFGSTGIGMFEQIYWSATFANKSSAQAIADFVQRSFTLDQPQVQIPGQNPLDTNAFGERPTYFPVWPPVSAYLSPLLIDSFTQGGEGTWQCRNVMTMTSGIGLFSR